MAQMAIRRGFHVGDLHNDLRGDPDRPVPGLGGRFEERTGSAPQAFKPGQQRGEGVLFEARADPAAIDQLAVLELAEQEGAEGAAGLVRQAVAANDEFILADAFALDPEAAAARAISSV